jgi:hypothetical protein
MKSMADLYVGLLNVDHISTMDKMQVVNLKTSVVARQFWPIFDQYRPTIIPGYNGSIFKLTK